MLMMRSRAPGGAPRAVGQAAIQVCDMLGNAAAKSYSEINEGSLSTGCIPRIRPYTPRSTTLERSCLPGMNPLCTGHACVASGVRRAKLTTAQTILLSQFFRDRGRQGTSVARFANDGQFIRLFFPLRGEDHQGGLEPNRHHETAHEVQHDKIQCLSSKGTCKKPMHNMGDHPDQGRCA